MNPANLIAFGLLAITTLSVITGVFIWAMRRPRTRILQWDPVSNRVKFSKVKPTGEVNLLLANGVKARAKLNAQKMGAAHNGQWFLFNEYTGQCFAPTVEGPPQDGAIDYFQLNHMSIDRTLNAWNKNKADFWKWIFYGLIVITVGGLIAFIVQTVGGG